MQQSRHFFPIDSLAFLFSRTCFTIFIKQSNIDLYSPLSGIIVRDKAPYFSAKLFNSNSSLFFIFLEFLFLTYIIAITA